MRTFLRSLDLDHYWSYDGSLTTPPCTEGIKWSVLEQVQPISDRQLAEHTAFFADNFAFSQGKGNNRVVQPPKARTVYKSTVPDFDPSDITFGTC